MSNEKEKEYYVKKKRTLLRTYDAAMLIAQNVLIEYFGEDCGRPQIQEYKRIQEQGEQFFINKWNSIEERRKRITLIYDPINPLLVE